MKYDLNIVNVKVVLGLLLGFILASYESFNVL